MRNISFKIIMLCLSGLLPVVVGCAAQKDVQILDDRLYRLEQQNEQLTGSNEERAKNEGQIRTQSAEIRSQVKQVYGEVENLRGRLEETDYLVRQSMKSTELRDAQLDATLRHLEESVKIIEHRLDRVEEFLDLKSAPSPTADSGGEKTAAPAPAAEDAQSAPASDQAAYDAAKERFDKGEFAKAREMFQAFLVRFPDSKNNDAAQFWIGETHYREGWFEKAILEYQQVLEKYPKGNKVRAALLKQGFAFYNIGDKTNAQLVLKELVAKYPKSTEAQLAADKLKVF